MNGIDNNLTPPLARTKQAPSGAHDEAALNGDNTRRPVNRDRFGLKRAMMAGLDPRQLLSHNEARGPRISSMPPIRRTSMVPSKINRRPLRRFVAVHGEIEERHGRARGANR
jgi:hypothetical protein